MIQHTSSRQHATVPKDGMEPKQSTEDKKGIYVIGTSQTDMHFFRKNAEEHDIKGEIAKVRRSITRELPFHRALRQSIESEYKLGVHPDIGDLLVIGSYKPESAAIVKTNSPYVQEGRISLFDPQAIVQRGLSTKEPFIDAVTCFTDLKEAVVHYFDNCKDHRYHHLGDRIVVVRSSIIGPVRNILEANLKGYKFHGVA